MNQNTPQKIQNRTKSLGFYAELMHRIARAQNINFWVLITFLPTFMGARFVVNTFPDLFLQVRGVHIHHLTYGIVILSVAGLLLLNMKREIFRVPLAILYGFGLALAFDEFGMWIHLRDDYWIRQSYDAIIMISALLLSLAYLPSVVKSSIAMWKKREERILEKKEEMLENVERKKML